MNVRDVLNLQSPSLALHRAMQNEIFRLDAEIAKAYGQRDAALEAAAHLAQKLHNAKETMGAALDLLDNSELRRYIQGLLS